MHERTVALRLVEGVVARGRVRTPDDFAACNAGVVVKVFRNGKVVAKVTTRDGGRFKVRLADRPGRYVARAPEVAPDDANTCASASSKTRRA